MLGKRKSQKSVTPVWKRRKDEPPIEEIQFDFDAREEYLTGFHKRKLQRIKHAKEEALKREREERVAARKALRENRKIDREKHVEAVNAALRDAEDTIQDDKSTDGQVERPSFIHETASIDHEDDYVDEDRHTVVTVEAVDVSHEGLQPRRDVSDSEDEVSMETSLAERAPNESYIKSKSKHTEEPTQPNPKPDARPMKKRKKFRYESKAERKVTRFKERKGGKARAKARRG